MGCAVYLGQKLADFPSFSTREEIAKTSVAPNRNRDTSITVCLSLQFAREALQMDVIGYVALPSHVQYMY